MTEDSAGGISYNVGSYESWESTLTLSLPLMNESLGGSTLTQSDQTERARDDGTSPLKL